VRGLLTGSHDFRSDFHGIGGVPCGGTSGALSDRARCLPSATSSVKDRLHRGPWPRERTAGPVRDPALYSLMIKPLFGAGRARMSAAGPRVGEDQPLT
jgi:hypothetical protein